MQKWIGITLIILLGQAQFLSSFFVAFRSIAPETFIEQFCENTDRPQLKCDGKCFLKKQVQAKEDFAKENSIEILCFNTLAIVVDFIGSFKEPGSLLLQVSETYRPFELSKYGPYIFHPPRLV